VPQTAANPVTLGHEFSGVVESVGPAARGVKVGDRVAVNPVFGCGACAVCATDPINCPHRTMLGIDRDGALAEFAVVPAANVHPVPGHVSDQAAAYAEPVAAALAVFNAGIAPHQKGLIFGANRFALLLEQVFRDAGYGDVSTFDFRANRYPLPLEDSFDFVIETELGPNILAHMMWVAKPGGTLILKSRVPKDVHLDFGPAVRKQLSLRGVNYGSFRRAVGLLVEGRLELGDVFGPVFALADWRAAFDAARSEATKVFIQPGEPRQL
jgi:threonine dehydrogenase-like Zn-dependent dehydrogenase